MNAWASIKDLTTAAESARKTIENTTFAAASPGRCPAWYFGGGEEKSVI